MVNRFGWALLRTAACSIAVLGGCGIGLAAEPRPFTLDDFKDIVTLMQPAISPDGRRVAVIVKRADWDDSKFTNALELVDVASAARRDLTPERKHVMTPLWSPDGSRLAFIATAGTGDSAKDQVFVLPFDGGEATPLTSAPEGVDDYAWSNDGTSIAYTAQDLQPKREKSERFRDSFVFTTQPITAREPARPSHLWVVRSAGGKARQLTSGPQSTDSRPAWSADDTTIAVTLAPNAILNDSNRARIAFVAVATGSITYPTGHTGYESDPQFSPDGKRLGYLHSDGDDQVNPVNLWVAPSTGGSGTPVASGFDRAVSAFTWRPDSRTIAFTAADGTRSALVSADVTAGTFASARGDIAITAFSSALRNGSVAFVGSTATTPPELYVQFSGAAPRKLTDYNAKIAALRPVRAETIDFATSLGINGDAVLVEPPDFSPARKYPLVLLIHGGPTSASILRFDPLASAMAARGWLVLEPNYRGSNNLGRSYQRGVLYDPEAGPGTDVMAAVAAVRARGIVDEHRLAVSGWSYGGIMTAWMISKYHIWQAAVSGASVDDWATDYGIADDSDSDAALFHGSPYIGANASEYQRASAISYAAGVTTPLLILSDIGDNRDPFGTSSMYYRALRDNGKDATLVVWPVDGHFPADPVRQADVFEKWLDFIAKHF